MELDSHVRFKISRQKHSLTLRTSLECLSKMCVVNGLCVRNHCLPMVFAIPPSCSAMYPRWLPCGSKITYLLACSNPRKIFIISICLWTTMPDSANRFLAGWSDLRTALGSSGMWTGASRLLSWSLVCASKLDMDGVPRPAGGGPSGLEDDGGGVCP